MNERMKQNPGRKREEEIHAIKYISYLEKKKNSLIKW
jgi:hypothetical protein